MKGIVKIFSLILGILMIIIGVCGIVGLVISLIKGSTDFSDQIIFLVMEAACLVIGFVLIKSLKKCRVGTLVALILAIALFLIEYFAFVGLTLIPGVISLLTAFGVNVSGLDVLLNISHYGLYVLFALSLVSLILQIVNIARSK